MALVCCRIFEPCEHLRIPEIGVFTTFTTLINGVIGIYGLYSAVANDAGDCSVSKKRTWLIVSVLLAALNVAFGFYLYFRISQKVDEGSRIFASMWKIFLYDVGVFLYMLAFIFIMIWCGVGSSWKNDDPEDGVSSDDVDACNTLGDAIGIEIALFLVYMIVGGIIMCFAISLACCRGDSGRPQTVITQQPQQQQQQKSWWPFGKKQAQPQPQAQAPPPQYHTGAPPVAPVQYQQAPQQQYPPQQQQYSPQHAPPQAQQQYPPQQQAQYQQPAAQPQYQQQPQQYQQQPQHQQPQYQQPQHQPTGEPQREGTLGEKVGNKIGAGFGKVFGKK